MSAIIYAVFGQTAILQYAEGLGGVFMKRLLFALAIVLASVAGWAGAATIIDQNAPDLGTSGINYDVTLDFGIELLPSNAAVTNQFGSYGVIFGGNYDYTWSGANLASVSYGVLSNLTQSNPGSIFFTQDVNAALFSWRTYAGTTTFSAFLDGILVESFSAATSLDTSSGGNYFGFNAINFDEIRISIDATLNGNPQYGFTLDNLNYTFSPTPVPLPATLPLMLAGLAGLGWVVRRRRGQ